jgi:hypothetical protein
LIYEIISRKGKILLVFWIWTWIIFSESEADHQRQDQPRCSTNVAIANAGSTNCAWLISDQSELCMGKPPGLDSSYIYIRLVVGRCAALRVNSFPLSSDRRFDEERDRDTKTIHARRPEEFVFVGNVEVCIEGGPVSNVLVSESRT